MNTVLITTSSFAVDSPALLKQLEASGLQVVLNPLKRKLTEEEATNLLQQHKPVGMIAGVEPLTRRVLAAADGLRVISRCGIGLDSVDLAAAKELGITVTNTPDAPTVPAAELALGLILSLLRGIPASDSGIRQGRWVRPMGRLLQHKTVGIVGCGRIGSRLAKMLSSMECRVLGGDPACPVNDHFELVELEKLLAEADIISLHLPYTAQTHYFMDAKRLAMMKPGSYLINAARGGLVDEDALYQALQSGHLAGAALDCFEQEPYQGPLTELENVVLTGHVGSYAREGRIRMEEQAVENLIRELQS